MTRAPSSRAPSSIRRHRSRIHMASSSTVTAPRQVSRKQKFPLASSAFILPALLAVGAMTWLYDLYNNRRRFTPNPIIHHAILLRTPGTQLSDPSNRVFCVRADRNILASGLLSHCHFEPEIMEDLSRKICNIPVRRLKEVLKLMMNMKENVDSVYELESPMPWGTEGRPARRVQREWVKAIGRILKEKEGGKPMPQGEDAVEIWDIRIKNRCEGWVVEPWHCGVGSLADDDEMPFTWSNGRTGISGRWPGNGTSRFST